MGWNYFYSWAITLPGEFPVLLHNEADPSIQSKWWLAPSSSIIGTHLSTTVHTYVTSKKRDSDPLLAGVWIAIGLVCVCSTNFLGVKVYGELEFWFSLIKVIAIIGLILMGIILDAGGGPSGDAIGFRYWKK